MLCSNRLFYIGCYDRIEDACAYAQFILESIHSKEMFKFLTIEPTTCWTYLMWMDQVI